MESKNPDVVELEFSQKYKRKHSENYFLKHRTGPLRKWSHSREEQIAREALKLAGNPNSVLDLPCGAGRFWPLLLEQKSRHIIAADYSSDMLDVAQEAHLMDMDERIQCLQTSAFSIDLEDDVVDSLFCMRLLHHVGKSENRKVMLNEFHRVTRDTAIISLWVDGNYKAWRRNKLEKNRERRNGRGSQNRFVVGRQQIETEFKTAGFDILGHIDFLPFYQMWRTYVLHKR